MTENDDAHAPPQARRWSPRLLLRAAQVRLRFVAVLALAFLVVGRWDDFRNRFDTPSLKSTYRTAPYLHDGRAPDLHSLFTVHNPDDLHGRTRGFTKQELDELIAYVRSL